jgi:EAL domain-containing protein (putative c-di-GMP-specific phosphodiesterase class I)
VIVRAAIGLAHELKFDVIVEGVETIDQLEAIRSWGARQVQGYYYSKPVSADGVVELMRVGTIAPVLGIGSLSPVHLQP